MPGQVYYESTRNLVLKGVDGLVFVADSQRKMLDSNIESLEKLYRSLSEVGVDLSEIPMTFQYNKRDLPDVLSTEELNAALNPKGHPFFEAVAEKGKGVFETLKGITKLTLKSIKAKLAAPSAKAKPKPAAAEPPRPRVTERISVAALRDMPDEGLAPSVKRVIGISAQDLRMVVENKGG